MNGRCLRWVQVRGGDDVAPGVVLVHGNHHFYGGERYAFKLQERVAVDWGTEPFEWRDVKDEAY